MAEFIGSPKINIIESRVREQGLIQVGDTTLEIGTELEPGAAITVGIRPETLQPAARAGHGVLSGRVRLIEYLGSDLHAHLDRPGQSGTLIVRLDAEHAHIAVGEMLHLSMRPDQVLLFDRDGRRIRARNAARPAGRDPFAVALAAPSLKYAR